MLEDFLTGHAYGMVLVFARVGSAFMILPGLAASYVPTQIRLILALGVSLIMYPTVIPLLPAEPQSIWVLAELVVSEVFYGVYLGLMAQFVVAALHLAGTAIGREGGLMNAMVYDPVTEQQGALVIGLLTNLAVVMIFTLDLHHVMLEALYQSYTLFKPGSVPTVGDHLTYATNVLAQSSFLALKLASPFIVFAIIFQSMMGLLVRLSPQMNIFFIALPLQILTGLALLWISLPAIMMWFLSFFENIFQSFIPG